MRRISRRMFLTETLQAAGLVALASMGARPARAEVPASAPAVDDVWVKLNKRDTYPDGKVTIVTEATDAGGKSVKVQFGVLRQQDQVSVISTRCTHKGCTVKVRDDGSFRCPCHWSTFAASGKVTRGFAKEPLRWYSVKVLDTGEVQVNTGKTVEPTVSP